MRAEFLPGFGDVGSVGRDHQLIIDSFAGGGGASTGIELALGRAPDFAINHCGKALAMHAANHPNTIHLKQDVFDVDLQAHTLGRKVGLLWASPDCRHFSRARGGKPTSKSVRMLAWSIVRFCQKLGACRPEVIVLENVPEFQSWEDFQPWLGALKKLGYKPEFKELRACDYGAPTIRKRLFMVARRDGKKIRWPKPTHGDPRAEGFAESGLKPWRTAAEIIDWTLPCHSIFLNREEGRMVGVKRPLSDNTLRRIAKGIVKYVLDAKEPFLVNMSHGGRCEPLHEPMRTITTTKGDVRLLVAAGIRRDFGSALGRSLRTVTSDRAGKATLVAAFLAQHNTGVIGRSCDAPLSTVTARGTQQAIVSSHLVNLKGTHRRGQALDSPMPSITAGGLHATEVRAFLIKYYGTSIGQAVDEPLGTVTTKDRFGLVTVQIHGEPYVITDIGMRMLSARELYRAQGFPDGHELTAEFEGKALTKTDLIKGCGNSVSPVIAQAIIESVCPDLKVGVA
ncbi:DNA cytosine methyltransferase [Pseudovibrio exalbescens]|uniref:DNA cytosine methyltransferase n=1 Tax=Pseudovibrio exalbescens TaxID=197461 RepID=UPI000C9A4A21|nr:DNA cytosine methyltransferase [Pseudovibrio exalbescens]